LPPIKYVLFDDGTGLLESMVTVSVGIGVEWRWR
jgi:hypothetical protein